MGDSSAKILSLISFLMKPRHCLGDWGHDCGLFAVLLALCLSLIACQSSVIAVNNTEAADETALCAADDGVLVKFRDARIAADPSVPEGGLNVKTSSRLRAAGLIHSQSLGLVPGLTRSTLVQGRSLEQTLVALNNSADVEYAEPDCLVSVVAIPNDPRFRQLYAMHNTGQAAGSVADADIDAPEAWDIQVGAGVVIAVIDTGVDYNHRDLQANMWSNPGEIANNGVDDDGNGFIDDIHGWDFSGQTNDPMDLNSHGTHVAGTIAAIGDNGVGVVGVNWKAKIMALKFMNARGDGTTSSAVQALQYAVRNGAKISNNSWGGGAFNQAMFDALLAAKNAGHIFVAAAGNGDGNGIGLNNDQTPHYPSSYTLNNVIAVAATDSADRLATFSNFGVKSVDLAAPGVAILSATPNNSYQPFNGTSMAAPLVSGIVGLMMAQRPNISISDARNALLNNVDAVGILAGKIATGGRANAFNVLSSLGGTGPAPPVEPPLLPLTVTPQNIEVLAGTDRTFAANGGVTPYAWSVDDTNVGTIDRNTGIFIGQNVGTTQVTVTDSAGGSAVAQATVVVDIAISPTATRQLMVNGQLSLSVQGGAGPYEWSLSDNVVASLQVNRATTQATLIADRVGAFTVTVIDSQQNSATTASIDIQAPALDSLIVSPSSAVISVGGSQDFTVTGGTEPYDWVSSDQTIVSLNAVNTQARVFGNRAAIADITITDATGVTVTAPIEVVTGAAPPPPANPPATPVPTTTPVPTATPRPTPMPSETPLPPGSGDSMQISPASPSTAIGGSVDLRVTGGTSPYTWTSSDTAVATFNALRDQARVFGNAAGSATMTVTDGDGMQVSVTLQVGDGGGGGTSPSPNPTPPPSNGNGFSIAPNNSSVEIGASVDLQISGGATPYRWTSSDDTIASFNAVGMQARVFANAVGRATMTVIDGDGMEATATINITDGIATPSPTPTPNPNPGTPPPGEGGGGISVTPSSAMLAAGDTVDLRASGGSGAYAWTSAGQRIASVNGSRAIARVFANASGSTSITVTDTAGASASVAIEVTGGSGGNAPPPPPPVSAGPITVSPQATSIRFGGSMRVTARGGIGPPYSWTVSNNLLGAVSGGDGNGAAVLRVSSPGGNPFPGQSIFVTARDGTSTRGTSQRITVNP